VARARAITIAAATPTLAAVHAPNTAKISSMTGMRLLRRGSKLTGQFGAALPSPASNSLMIA
jgi:hypothetical protein